MSISATPGRCSELLATAAPALSVFSFGSFGAAAREFSGLPSRMRLIGLEGLMTVDLPTLTCTTGAMSTRPQGAVG